MELKKVEGHNALVESMNNGQPNFLLKLKENGLVKPMWATGRYLEHVGQFMTHGRIYEFGQIEEIYILP